jgi:hypothetical protein
MRPDGRRSHDAAAALLVGGLVFALYWRTLLPHLGGTEDTAKFQFLGSVLGTAHSPGYPLYVLVSYVFSRLPFGTLAYRINLMSACFGATASALCFLIARRLGSHRIVAAAVAVALAGGHYFWENSVFAEVYTLNAALCAGAIFFLARWMDSTGDGNLYAATICVALGGGNHLTILGIIPAAFAFLLLSGRRWYRPQTVCTCAAILAAGVAQYGFIWLRTRQHGTYLESQASSVGELVDVMTARRYANLMFHFDRHAMLVDRVPLLWSTCRAEMGYLGIAAAILGLVMLRKRPAYLALFGVAIISVVALTANVVADTGGFLLPVFMLLWVAASVGLEGLWAAAVRHIGGPAGTVVLGLVVLIPLGQLRDNYATADHHSDRFASRYFEALFQSLPRRSAVITDDYTPEQMLHYGIVSRDFRRDGPPPQSAEADPEEVDRLLAHGVSVFAFPRAAGPLRSYGFRLAPFQLWGWTLRDYAHDIEDGQLVAVGASGIDLPTDLSHVLDGRAIRASGTAPVLAIVAVKGATGFTMRSVESASAELSLPAGEKIGHASVPLPVGVTVTATSTAATITLDGREVVTAHDGVAMAVFDPDGRVRDRRRFEPAHGFTSELRMDPWPLVQVTGRNMCLAIGGGAWHDVTGVSQGGGVDARIDNRHTFEASVLFYLASSTPLKPELLGFYGGCQGAEPCPTIEPPRLAYDGYRSDSPDDRDALRARMQSDGLPSADALLEASHVYRVETTANDQGQYVAYWLNYGGVPSRAFARGRTDDPAPARAAVCAWPTAESPAPSAGTEP